MTTTDRIRLVAEAIKRHDALEAAWAPFLDTFKTHDFPAFEESWRTFGAYLEATATLIGDTAPRPGFWLRWFFYDNHRGAKSYSAKATSWPESREIKTVADIVALIEADLPPDPLDDLESMARQHCDTRRVDRDYNGQVAGTLVTDSGAISANAEALETLADAGRFRIVAEGGRMVVGYWPENDPEKKQ
jgi:hypothetical protein